MSAAPPRDIEAIRHVLSRATGTGWEAAYRQDVGALLDEVERLRSINDDYLLEMGRQHALLRRRAPPRGRSMMNRLPHVRAPDGDPDVCVHCREEWVDLLTLYETDECSVRLRGALDAERAAVVAFVRRARLDEPADAIERGEHRREETE